MDINVNALTLTKALDDNKFKTELIECLNGVVDEELEKGEYMDTDLIEDCTELIFELENGYDVLDIKKDASDKIIKLANKKVKNRKVTRRALIAAVVVIMLLPNSVVYATVPAYQEFIDNVIERINDLSFDMSFNTHKDFTDVSNLEIEPEIEELSVISGPNDIDESKVIVRIKHFEGEDETISLAELRDLAKHNEHIKVHDEYFDDDSGRGIYTYYVAIDGAEVGLTYYVEE